MHCSRSTPAEGMRYKTNIENALDVSVLHPSFVGGNLDFFRSFLCGGRREDGGHVQ